MEATIAEQFALKMARASFAQLKSKNVLSSRWTRIEPEFGGNGARLGTVGIDFEGNESNLVAEYNLLAVGTGVSWNQGRCKLWFGTDRDNSWDFYCVQEANGLVSVPTAIMRSRLLEEMTTRNAIEGLGQNNGSIARNLIRLGYTADPDGVVKLVDDMFGPDVVLEHSGDKWGLMPAVWADKEFVTRRPLPVAISRFLAESVTLAV